MSGSSEIQMHEEPNSSDHAQHDLLVIAALADRGATGDEADPARAQIAACSDCAALHADLVSLATATRQLPPIERPRDFRLRSVDAQRLRPNLIRRLFGSFGTPRDGFSRPLAAGLTTLGLAGLMLGILPGTVSLGGGGSAAATSAPAEAPVLGAPAPAVPEAAGGAAEAQASPDLSQQFAADRAALELRPDNAGELEGEGLGSPVLGSSELVASAPVAPVPEDTDASELIVISGTLLIIGLGLFALRWTSRRFGG